MANINKIKYYPDRFYIGLDGFDLTKLFEVSPDYTLSLQQAIFIHEYFPSDGGQSLVTRILCRRTGYIL